jgi:hypothetical protein
MAARKRAKKRAKKSRKKSPAKRRAKKRGGKMPLVVLEHLAAGAVAAVAKRKGKVRKHTKAELKKARRK